MPDPGAKSISITTPSGACGGLALSDQSGNLAFADSPGSWTTYDSQGHPLGTFSSFGAAIPRESGWFAVNVWTGAGAPMDQWHLWTRAPDGAESSNTSVGNDACGASVAPTSAGGVLVLSNCGNGVAGHTIVMAFDDSGKRRYATAVDAYPLSVGVGDANGNVLVAAMGDAVKGFASSDLVARWLGPDGALLGGWFVITKNGGPDPRLQLRSLIGGGVAVMQEQVWRAVLPSGGAPKPLPAWLADRTGDLHIVRGRTAYAFTSSTGRSEVEIVAPSGTSCGKFDAQGSSVSIGTDGSVMALSGSGSCNRIVWPALLRAR